MSSNINMNGYLLDNKARHDTLRPIFTPQHASIVCIGAGVSGIALTIALQQTMDNYTLEIFEKNNDVGGTWLENRYPGCACKELHFQTEVYCTNLIDF